MIISSMITDKGGGPTQKIYEPYTPGIWWKKKDGQEEEEEDDVSVVVGKIYTIYFLWNLWQYLQAIWIQKKIYKKKCKRRA